MTSEDGPPIPSEENTEIEIGETPHGRAGFISGFVLGALMGAGLALLFAPERGDRTRNRLRRRMQALREDALDSMDEMGHRGRAELHRRRRRLKAELEQLRQRAKARAEEAKKSLES
jgi:gas vesicle protein